MPTRPLGAVLAACLFLSALVTPGVVGAREEPFYSGYYQFHENYPAGLGELVFFQLDDFDLKPPNFAYTRTPLHGSLLIGKREYVFAKVARKNRVLTFTTKPIAVVSFSFDGRFLRAAPFENSPEEIVVQGTLRNLVRGSVTVKGAVKCNYFSGD